MCTNICGKCCKNTNEPYGRLWVANTMEKMQVEWVVWEAQYQKEKTCLEKVRGFVVKAKLFAFEEKEAFILLSKSHTFDFKLLSLGKSMDEAQKY